MRLLRSIPPLFLAIAITTLSGTSFCQSAEASSTGKGITGGALLGAEAVMLTEAAFDVSPDWLYWVGGGAGAIGGGVGGYFLEGELSAKSNMFLLASGMLLVIPTTVAVLSATAYEPPSDVTEDQGAGDELEANPASVPPPGAQTAPTQPAPDASTPATSSARPRGTPRGLRAGRQLRVRPQYPTALLDMGKAGLTLGVPQIEVGGAYSPDELAKYGLVQCPELRVSLLDLAF